MDWATVFNTFITLLQSPWFASFIASLAKKQALSSGPLTVEAFRAHLDEFSREG